MKRVSFMAGSRICFLVFWLLDVISLSVKRLVVIVHQYSYNDLLSINSGSSYEKRFDVHLR
jgi:hypothetical protein